MRVCGCFSARHLGSEHVEGSLMFSPQRPLWFGPVPDTSPSRDVSCADTALSFLPCGLLSDEK